MNEELGIILETTSKILGKHVNHKLRQNIDNQNPDLTNLWTEIEQLGLPKIAVKDKFNGSGLPLSSTLPIIKLSNNIGAPIGIITYAIDAKDLKIIGNEISGDLISVPYLNLTDKIICITEIDNSKQVILVKSNTEEKELKKNFLSEPRYNLKLKKCKILDIKPLNLSINFKYLGAIVRSAQMIGSMEKILDLCIDYCSQRKQFGRALSKFQAIQHQISEMAVELAASSAALSTITNSEVFYKNNKDIAILKIRAGSAAGKIIAISHQVHGAIGFTQEYELAYFTRNLNSWRNDFGNESYWEDFLGKDFLEKNNKNLWEYLT